MMGHSSVLAKLSNEYGDFIVSDTIYNQRPARILFSQPSNAAQSGLPLDNNPRLLFDYNQRFLEFALDIMPKKILVLGGGTLTLASALRLNLPNANMVVVEQNIGLIELAKQYFGYTPSSQLKVVIADARQYIESTKAKFELVIIDLYDDYTIPAEFQSLSFYQCLTNRLSDNGFLAINVIATIGLTTSTVIQQIAMSLESVFANYRIIQADQGFHYLPQNLLVFASKNKPFNAKWFNQYIEHTNILLKK